MRPQRNLGVQTSMLSHPSARKKGQEKRAVSLSHTPETSQLGILGSDLGWVFLVLLLLAVGWLFAFSWLRFFLTKY